ncbi:MAG TPA: hypothetical protein VMU00_03500 [Steroidobacteraceae bacterium]|nr:hypothetical protein [Steroidobacteraceae bacterium]
MPPLSTIACTPPLAETDAVSTLVRVEVVSDDGTRPMPLLVLPPLLLLLLLVLVTA